MKIADYGKAITSYIESPTKKEKELSKLRAESANRTLLADGTPPPSKPKQLKDLFEKINRTVLAVRSNTIQPEFILPALEELTQEYVADGLISGAEARKFAIERKEYWDKWISENPKQTTPVFDFDNEGNATEVDQEEIIKRINEADGGLVKQGPNTGKYVLRYTQDGKRVRKFFDTKEEFEAFAKMRRELPKGGPRGDYTKQISTPSAKEIEIAELVYGNKYDKKGVELWQSLKRKERQGIRQGSTTGSTILKGKGPQPTAPNQLNKENFIKLAKANKGKTFNEFLEVLKPYKTLRGADFTIDSIRDRIKMYDLGAGFFKREPGKGFSDEAKGKAVKKRVSSLERTGTGTSADVKIKGSPSYHFHHIRQIGGEVPLTTDDLAILDQRMNSIIGSRYNKKLNKIADQISENMKLALEAMNAKQEGKALDYMKKVDQLNLDAEKIVNTAIKELPAPYKKMVGFNKFTLPVDEYGLPIGNEPLIVKKVGGTKPTKDAKNLQDLTFEEIRALKNQIKKDATKLEDSGLRTKILKKAGTALKTAGKVIKPIGYAVGIGSAFQAKSIADEMGISLKPQDYAAAVEMGDPQMAINMWKMRNDPEYAAAERAKTLAIPLDEGTYDAIDNQTTFGKYNDQIKNIKLP